MGFYVKYPPHGDEHFRAPRVEGHLRGKHDEYIPPEWKPCTYGTEPEYANTSRAIRRCKSSFEETGNPLYALEAFRLATAAKLYPPLWAITFINERLVHAFARDLSLDRAFGFSHDGLGSGKRTDPRTEDRLRARDRLLCLAVFKLEAAGLKRRPACDALAKRLQNLRSDEAILVGKREILKPSAKNPFPRTGKGIQLAIERAEERFVEEKELAMAAGKTWTIAQKREMLLPFFPDGIPIVLTEGN